MKPLSASQISTFLSCQRAWAFAYLENKRLPGTKATELGSAIHKNLEDWTRHGTAPTLPQARALMSFIPAPGIAEAETALTLNTPSSPWRGFIDSVYSLDDQGNPVKAFSTPHVVVVDFKSTSSMQYAKSAEHLATEDSQAGLYGAWAFGKGAERVTGRWLYVQTRGAVQTRAVEFEFTRASVQATVDKLDVDAKEVQRLYSIRPKASTLPANLSHCSAYGGCGHKSYCDRSPVQGAISMSDSTDFASFISARFPSTGAVPPAPPAPVMAVPPPPMPVPPPPAPPLTEDVDGSRTEDFFAQTVGPKAALRIMEQVKKESVLPPPPPFVPASPADALRPNDRHGMIEAGRLPDGTPVRFDHGKQILIDPPFGKAVAVPGTPGVFIQTEGRPQVERGMINPNEAPLYAPASPEEAALMVPVINTSTTHTPDVLDSMDRGALKALNIRLGLCTDSSRFQEPKLRANIREYAQTHSVSVDEVVAGPSVDTSADVYTVGGGDLPPIEDCQFRGEQLEADRLETRPEVIREYKEALGLTSEERDAVQSATLSVSSGQESDHFAAIRAIIREELGAYFAARFGR